MKILLEESLNSAYEVVRSINTDANLRASLESIARSCVDALRDGRKIILAGNGGSAADAQHIAGELVSRYMFDRPGMAAIALTTDTSVITAIGNDYGYEELFARQIQSLGQAGDIFIAYSTSGNSKNILNGLKAARLLGLVCVGFTGNRKGQICKMCDHILEVPSHSTPRIQEGHLLLGHTLCALIEDALFASLR